MKIHQRLAMENPCESPEDLADMKFRELYEGSGENLYSRSITICVSQPGFFSGRSFWMISVAIMLKIPQYTGPVPRQLWNAETETLIRYEALDGLAGVGFPNTDIHDEGDISLIIRRQCTAGERRQIKKTIEEK